MDRQVDDLLDRRHFPLCHVIVFDQLELKDVAKSLIFSHDPLLVAFFLLFSSCDQFVNCWKKWSFSQPEVL